MEEWDLAAPSDLVGPDDSGEGEVSRDFPGSIAVASSPCSPSAASSGGAGLGVGPPPSEEVSRLGRENFVDYLLRHRVAIVARLNHDFECSRQVNYIQIFGEAGLRVEPCVFPDGGVPSKAVVRSFLRIVRWAREQGMCVAVHCMGGLGRTGVMIGAYAASRHGMSGKAFHGWTRMCRPGTVQTTKQEFFLRAFKPGGPPVRCSSFTSMLSYISTGSSPAHSLARSEGTRTRLPTSASASQCTAATEQEEKSREMVPDQDLAPMNSNGIMEVVDRMKVITVGGGVADI